MGWYIEVLKKYAVFSGRARRKEYWLFVLINILFLFVLGFISGGLAWVRGYGHEFMAGVPSVVGSYLGLVWPLYILAVLIPLIAVRVRRLHDTNRSGWWLLIGLVPIIGAIVLLVFFASDSQAGSNRYGPNPKEVAV